MKFCSHFPLVSLRRESKALVSAILILSFSFFLLPAFHGERTVRAKVSPTQTMPARLCILPPTIKKGSLSGRRLWIG